MRIFIYQKKFVLLYPYFAEVCRFGICHRGI